MDLAAGAVDPPPGGGSGVHDGGGGDSDQRLGRRDEPSWIAAATTHPSEGSRGSGPHAAGSGLPEPNLAGKLQGRRPRLHDNGGGGATARQLRLDGIGVDGDGCGAVSGRLDGSGGAGALPLLYRELLGTGGGDGRPTGKTQVAKARLFPVRSHRPDSTWRPTGGVAEVAWVSVLGSSGVVKGVGGRVIFLAVGQANPVWGAPPLLCGELLGRMKMVVGLQGKLWLLRQCCSLSRHPWAGFDGEAGERRGGGSLGQRAGGGDRCCGSLVIGRTGSRPVEGRRSGVAEAMCRRC
uniref:Uncharacterized protein n=1 Tax=Oryza nivara TaxID=4536 RepID=A0A0E0J6P3_ORYNI